MSVRPGKRVLAGVAATGILLTVCGLLSLATTAGAAATGSIAGTVTAPMGTQVVVTICAIASGGEETCATTLATNINGSSPGAYEISGLASGDYKVSFAARCSEEPCPGTFPPEYYDNQISLAKAIPVEVGAAETIGGIDAGIEGAGERQVREYLEDETEASPTGTSTSTAPGAIEPAPVNKKLEEEFWAHPPWDRSMTSAPSTSSTPAGGLAVAASAAAVEDASAEIPLHCAGAGACNGLLALVGRTTAKKFVKRHGRRVTVKQVRKILVGTAGFSLAAGTSETLSVRLTKIGQTLIAKAGNRALKVALTGSGVKAGALVLESAPAKNSGS